MSVSETQLPFLEDVGLMDNKNSLEPGFFDKIFMSEHLQKSVSPFEIKTSIHNCFSCDNKHYNKPLELSNFDASVMVIGEVPSDIDFKSAEGKLLADTLSWAKFDLQDIYFTSLIKCESSLTPEKCYHHLLAELLSVRPTLIISLGYDVGKYFDSTINQPGYSSLIMGRYNMITTYRTLYVMNEESLFQSYCNDMLRGNHLVNSIK